jgi:hypothetical protein
MKLAVPLDPLSFVLRVEVLLPILVVDHPRTVGVGIGCIILVLNAYTQRCVTHLSNIGAKVLQLVLSSLLNAVIITVGGMVDYAWPGLHLSLDRVVIFLHVVALIWVPLMSIRVVLVFLPWYISFARKVVNKKRGRQIQPASEGNGMRTTDVLMADSEKGTDSTSGTSPLIL